jgi:hypothetical protein
MHRDKAPRFEVYDTTIAIVRALCEKFHGYEGSGDVAVYAFGVLENGPIGPVDVVRPNGLRVVMATAWQPPPPGAAKSVCPEAPQGVLALSRMVAVPRDDRELQHISKPLRWQMRDARAIDRTRWPVLVTYSDEGQGHTGHVYKCSGWQKTTRRRVRIFEDENGVRSSSYANGASGKRGLRAVGHTWIQRWEHWVMPFDATRDDRVEASQRALIWMTSHGWRREPVPGKVWRSGSQAFRYVRAAC